MKGIIKNVSILLALILILSFGTAFADEQVLPITVTLDNTQLVFDVPAQIINGRTLVPMRTIFESFDMVVLWDESEKKVTAKSEGNEILLKVGDTNALVNGENVKLDVGAQMVSDRVLVPLRFVSEALGCKVNWNDSARSVKISSEMERKPLEIKSIKSIDDLETKELVDKNYATKWTHESPQSWLLFELAEVTTVGYAGVSWYQGKQRYADFEIQVSVDGENFETAFDGTAGYGETFLPYSLGNKQAKFIKFIGKGNDVNGINSVQEIRFYPPHKSGQILINDQDMLGREREPVEVTPELRAALDELEKLFEPDRVLTLIASLYDKEIGGFYGAASARDYPQFLPDIESTNVALSFMKTYGALEMDMLGEELTNKIVTWLQGLQNPDDGFFYLPQDKGLADINILYRSTNSAKTCLSRLGATALYPYPWDRGISQSTSGEGITYESKQDVRAYIESLPWNQNPWNSAPLIWNGWNLIAIMKEISRNHGGDFPTQANAFLNNNAAEMINITAKNLELFKATKDAGAFSTYQAAIGGVSDNEGIKRGLGIAGEGDISATGGVYLSALGQIYKSLEIPSPVASMLSEEDGVRFFNLLKNAKPIKRHSLYDVAFDFEDDKYTLGEAPMDDLIKNTIDTGASVTVVEDPLSKNGKVLRIETLEDKNYGVQTKFALGYLEDIKKATVSFDIYIPREGVLNNAEVFYGIAFGGMLRFDIYSNSKNSGFYLRYNGSDDGLSPWCRYDEGWHNIKLEYDAEEEECIKIYIDNALSLSSADYSLYPQKPYTKGFNLLNFTFGGYKSSIGYSFIDNIKIFKD